MEKKQSESGDFNDSAVKSKPPVPPLADESQLPTLASEDSTDSDVEPKKEAASSEDGSERPADDNSQSRKDKHLARFEDAALNPVILDTLKSVGWEEPTPIQAQSLPHCLRGREVAGFAQTGTGKTGVFLITLAQKWLSKDESSSSGPFAVVVAPTRELAMQIEDDGRPFFERLGLKSASVFGGSDWEAQAEALRKGVDVVMATPGRLRDFEKQGLIDLEQVRLFVCDEVDRMFDMGFIDDVEFFLSKLSEHAQKLMFSATTNARVEELTYQYLDQPEYIYINSEEVAPDSIDQHAFICESPDKFRILLHLIRQNGDEQRSIIFTNTKLTAAWLDQKLKGNGIDSHLITGDLPQPKRTRLIKQIKEGDIQFLIATDVASRGLHISGVTHVYNFDVPDDPANYVHRIGRTARAGTKGTSYVLVCDEYGENFLGVQKLLLRDAPTPVWMDLDLSSIEDASDNPFDGALSRTFRDSGRSDRFGGGRRDGFRSGRDRDGNSPRRGDRDGRPHGGKRPGPGSRRDDDRFRSGERRPRGASSSDQRPQEGRRHDMDRGDRGRPDQPRRSASAARSLPSQKSKETGFFAILRRIFRLVFRLKTPVDDRSNQKSHGQHRGNGPRRHDKRRGDGPRRHDGPRRGDGHRRNDHRNDHRRPRRPSNRRPQRGGGGNHRHDMSRDR